MRALYGFRARYLHGNEQENSREQRGIRYPKKFTTPFLVPRNRDFQELEMNSNLLKLAAQDKLDHGDLVHLTKMEVTIPVRT